MHVVLGCYVTPDDGPTARDCRHGGLVAAELDALGIHPGDVLDVSVNVNPYGPCPAVRDTIARAALERYPDPSAAPARRSAARWLGVPDERVVLGNGAVDILWLLARTALGRGDVVMTVEPTFSEMREAARCVGARVEAHHTDPQRDFALDPAALDASIAEHRPRVVYACMPSNPAGRWTPPSVFVDLAERHPETLFVVDLSFLSLSTHATETPWRGSAKIVWLRSLTKDHALAGLRVGCAVAPAEVVERLEAARPPWSVNAFAQEAITAIASPGADDFVATARARLLADRLALEEGLRMLAVRTIPSETVFLLADLGARSAASVRTAMLRDHRVLVRDGSSFGLPHHIRLAARPAEDTKRLLAALASVLGR